jgi:XTP/dITP diphosphohydrolase
MQTTKKGAPLRKILLATQNKGKLKEIQPLLEGLPIEFLTPADLNLYLDVKEDGASYAENAALKAQAYALASGLIALADDTGLEVDALHGAPGLYSARYAPWQNATDTDRCQYLLENLRPHPRPWVARFRCVVAIARPEGPVEFTEGILPGEITTEGRGGHGFGYDPIFLITPLGRTLAELTLEEKNRMSHRARAVLAARPILAKISASPTW